MEAGNLTKDHQEKIKNRLKALKHDLSVLQSQFRNDSSSDTSKDLLVAMVSQLNTLEEDLLYITEVLQCKQLMLETNVEYVKKLEAELTELKTQKR